MQDQQRTWGFFAHTNIIVGMMFVVFFVIDRFNPAMEFLTSSLSKWLILVLALCAIVNGLFAAVFLFQRQKRREEKHGYPQARPAYGQDRPQRELPQPAYDTRRYPREGRQQNGYRMPESRQPYPQRQPYGQVYGQAGYPDERRNPYGRQ